MLVGEYNKKIAEGSAFKVAERVERGEGFLPWILGKGGTE